MLENRNGLNGGVISFNGVSKIPDPIRVLMGEKYGFNGGVMIIAGVIRFNGVKFYRRPLLLTSTKLINTSYFNGAVICCNGGVVCFNGDVICINGGFMFIGGLIWMSYAS